MSRTIRWAKETQKDELKYFDNRFCNDWKYVRQNGSWVRVYFNHQAIVEESKRLRRDGVFSRNGKQYYKWKRNKERRSFERIELKLIEHGKKDHFDDTFEGDKEWID